MQLNTTRVKLTMLAVNVAAVVAGIFAGVWLIETLT